MRVLTTIYCGKRHRATDGVPLAHACRILAPEFLEAERRCDFLRAADVIEAMPLVLHGGIEAPADAPALASTA